MAAQQRQLHHAVELEDLKADLEKEKLLAEIATHQARRRMMENTTSDEPGPPLAAGSAPLPPPVQEDLPATELQNLALKGLLCRAKSDRAWKDWTETILRDYPSWTAQQIIETAARLYDQSNR